MEVNRSFLGRLYTDILIPLDGSKVAERVISCARSLAKLAEV